MNYHYDPATGAIFRYSTRKNSRIIIQSKLPLDHRGALKRIPMTVIIDRDYNPFIRFGQKEAIDHLSRWAWVIVEALVFGSFSTKKDLIIFNIDNPKTCVKVRREDLLFLRSLIPHKRDDNENFRAHLNGLLLFFFFNPKIMTLIAKPPRGAKSGQQYLLNALPGALFACHELVVAAERGDRRLESKIKDIIESEAKYLNYLRINEIPTATEGFGYIDSPEEISPTFRQQATIICLVDYAFAGAWETYGYPGLLNRSPQDIFRDYLYGKKQRPSAQLLKNCEAEDRQKILDCWVEMYLSDAPGAAAKGLGLI